MVSSAKHFKLLHYFNTPVEHSHFSLNFFPRTNASFSYLQDIHVTSCHENYCACGGVVPWRGCCVLEFGAWLLCVLKKFDALLLCSP